MLRVEDTAKEKSRRESCFENVTSFFFQNIAEMFNFILFSTVLNFMILRGVQIYRG